MAIHKRIIPSFNKSNMIICNYNHNLLDEILHCLNEMSLLKDDEFFNKLKRMIFRYITIQDFAGDRDELRHLCKARGTEIYKRMFNLLKYLDHDLFLDNILSKYTNNFDLFLAINVEHGEYFKKKFKSFEYILVKDLRNYYFNNKVLSFFPLNIFDSIYLIPSAENNLIMQYIKWSNIKLKIFNCDLIYENLNYDVDLPFIGKKEDDTIYYINDSVCEYEGISSFKEYILINNDFIVIRDRLEENKKYFYKYYVDNIDYEKFTQSGLKKLRYLKMQRWKDGLGEEKNLHRLCTFLKHYGAVKANITNVKNWMREDTIAPEGEMDFRAILKYCGIQDESEVINYFNIAKELRSESISQGHINKDIVYDLIVEFLSDNKDNLDELSRDEHFNLSGILFSLKRGYI